MNYAAWVAMMEWFWLTPTTVFIHKTHFSTPWGAKGSPLCEQSIHTPMQYAENVILDLLKQPTTSNDTNTKKKRKWIARISFSVRIYAQNHSPSNHTHHIGYHISHTHLFYEVLRRYDEKPSVGLATPPQSPFHLVAAEHMLYRDAFEYSIGGTVSGKSWH